MIERERSRNWHWWVSGLLLLATMINYMDRQTLSNLSVRITNSFQLTEEQYGDFEVTFGLAFAVGSLFFGIIADRVSVRWLYPLVLVAWSLVGIATGLTTGYRSMLICRGFLGFFEAGHWPCALIVTQAVMSRGNRAMGNSVLQSGASLGAILTPIIIVAMVGNTPTDGVDQTAWRLPFIVIGGVGILWAMLWLASIREDDLKVHRADDGMFVFSVRHGLSSSSAIPDSGRWRPWLSASTLPGNSFELGYRSFSSKEEAMRRAKRFSLTLPTTSPPMLVASLQALPRYGWCGAVRAFIGDV